jgi:hypothetical protein
MLELDLGWLGVAGLAGYSHRPPWSSARSRLLRADDLEARRMNRIQLDTAPTVFTQISGNSMFFGIFRFTARLG